MTPSALLCWVGLAWAGETQRWLAPVPSAHTENPAGLVGVTAQDCGQCHVEIAKEWAVSTHAHAWTDRQFQAEYAKDPEVGWLCLNCHTPAGDQQAVLSTYTGDIRNPQQQKNHRFREEWQQEGVSCAACHVREGRILGPFGVSTAPHPVEQSNSLLTSEVCLSCHQANVRLEDALVCAFNTGVEASESGTEKTCQSCHMPKVDRPLVPGGQSRPGRMHLWLGGGVPKTALTPEEKVYYDMFEPGLDVELEPLVLSSGKRAELGVVLVNARAGHMLPTGDPERFYRVVIRVTGEDGRLLVHQEERIGQEWTWSPRAQKLSDNRLAPSERRVVQVSFKAPRGPVNVEVVAEHWRISNANAEYHNLGSYPRKTEALRRNWTLETGR